MRFRIGYAGFQNPIGTSDRLLELGKARVAHRDLTLELAHVSGRLEIVSSEKEVWREGVYEVGKIG